MEKKRILHIINGEYYSGAEKVQDLLALKLSEMGYEIGFACLKPDLFPSKRLSKNIPIYKVPMKSLFGIKKCSKIVSQIVRNDKYDLMHTHTPRAALIGSISSLMSSTPFVHHVHSPTVRDSELYVKNVINAFIEKKCLKRSSMLLPVSNSLHRYLIEQGFRKNKIVTVPNGVSIIKELDKRKTPDKNWTIGVVALYRPRKGLEVLLDALEIVYDKYKYIHLNVVGPFVSPSYEKKIKDIASSKGIIDIIDWIGFTDNVNYELSKMDIFVLPSLFGEGMPMVILEAMAMGVPTISTNVEGIPELLDDNSTGIIVPPYDSKALARGILKIIKSTTVWNDLRINAHKKQSISFSDSSMANAVSNIYMELLSERESGFV